MFQFSFNSILSFSFISQSFLHFAQQFQFLKPHKMQRSEVERIYQAYQKRRYFSKWVETMSIDIIKSFTDSNGFYSTHESQELKFTSILWPYIRTIFKKANNLGYRRFFHGDKAQFWLWVVIRKVGCYIATNI